MKILNWVPVIMMLVSCNQQEKPADNIQIAAYPVAKKDKIIDTYFGTKIAEPYRWLENDTSSETKKWVEAENKVTQNYLGQIPYRQKIKDRLIEIWNYPKESAPSKVGDYYFFTKNNGLQNQSVWYYKKGIEGEEVVFLDPNTITKAGTASISLLGFSKNKKYVAYAIAESGSDWSTIYIMEVGSRKKLKDEIKWVKFSGAAWKGNGFYYSGYDAPKKGLELSGATTSQKIYFHKLGDSQEKDALIYKEQNPKLYLSAQITEDERFLSINISAGTSGNALKVQDLSKPKAKIQDLITGFAHNHHIIDHFEGKLLVQTDLNAPNGCVVSIDPEKPATANWKTIIPERKNILSDIRKGGGFLWAHYLKDASSQMIQFQYDGKELKALTLPGIGTVSGFDAAKEDKDFYYTFTNFTTPETVYHYIINEGKSELYKKSQLKINTEGYVTKQVWYPSKDGTQIPMFIVHKKGIKMDGQNPVYLYGYGGFQINLTPTFSLTKMIFLEKGGIYVQPSLRGGSEFGEAWHKAGMLANKQHVFDDFISAAEYLIKEKYTNKEKIAIAGSSNGGLLVGACMTQRPDLFKVALPGVGVLDMLRYHRFTVGWGWGVEYGTSDKKDQFEYLIKYSPLHQVKANVAYPATLITTADHDDRVVPAHSFKFAATLQEKYKGNNPILIRVDKNAGHGAGKPTSKSIEEWTDIWSFVFQNLNLKY